MLRNPSRCALAVRSELLGGQRRNMCWQMPQGGGIEPGSHSRRLQLKHPSSGLSDVVEEVLHSRHVQAQIL